MMFIRHLLSIVVLPFTVTVLVPAALLHREFSASSAPIRVVGWMMVTIGLSLVFYTIATFATRGSGTLAPWDPPSRLVITGAYRHVRNPMISGVILILAGEALAFSSASIGVWAAAVFAVNAVYIPLIEEPGLARRFGGDYELYKEHVPRWVPRLSPWYPSAREG